VPVHVLIERPGAPPEGRDLTGSTTAGGSQADGISLPGAAPGALRLSPCAIGVVVDAAAAGVRAAGKPLAPGARRLLRAGERVELHGASIALPAAAPPDGTRAAAGAVLREAAAAGAPGPRLVVLTGRDAGACYPLVATQVLGRARSASPRIADPRASRRHARIDLAPTGAAIVDLGAKNGLFVNGVRVDRSARPLRHGDELGIGDTLLAFEDPWAAPAPASAPGTNAPAHRATARRASLEPRIAAAALLAASALALVVAAR
jgi:FHA domain